MNATAQTIVERLARLHQFANLFQQELKEVTQLVKKEFGVVVDPASTSPEDMQQILANLEAHQKKDGNSRGLLIGALLQQYLSSVVIEGGVGALLPTKELQQYEECLFSTPISQAGQWPEGFYRNIATKETQFLLKGEGGVFWVFDRLPGNDVVMLYVTDAQPFPTRTEDMTEELFNSVLTSLEEALRIKRLQLVER